MNKLTKSLRAYKKCFSNFTGRKDQKRPVPDQGTRAAISIQFDSKRREEKKIVRRNYLKKTL